MPKYRVTGYIYTEVPTRVEEVVTADTEREAEQEVIDDVIAGTDELYLNSDVDIIEIKEGE